jgi:hypothetical protein
MAVNAEEEHRGIREEDVLRAIAVVNIPIDDEDAFQTMDRAGVRRGQSDVVEQAKAHAMGGRGMMAGGPHQAQRRPVATAQDSVHGRDTGTGRGEGHLERVGRDDGVRIKQSAPMLGDLAGALDNPPFMNAQHTCGRQRVKRP